ncbi:MAG: hypothetical protein IJT34_05800 [Butyrivibrio sp.]|nr:hypothetical protein [Butyrivibrio sp.]
MKRRFTLFLLLTLLLMVGHSVTEQIQEQIGWVMDRSTPCGAEGCSAPVSAQSHLARPSCLIPFAEEASGVFSRRGRASVRRAVSDAGRYTHLRLQYLLFFLIVLADFLLHNGRYDSLAGRCILPFSNKIICYLHDQDGMK